MVGYNFIFNLQSLAHNLHYIRYNNHLKINKMTDLSTLVTTLEEQSTRKRDLIVPTRTMKMINPERLEIEVGGASEYIKPNEIFESQIASKLGIPKAYFDKMKGERPDLLMENVNSWLDFYNDKAYLLRNFMNDDEQDLTGRAFLSDRYHVIDNYDVLYASLKAIKEMNANIEIKSADVSDKRLYIHVTSPEIEVKANDLLENYMKSTGNGVGNGVFAGFIITNSEIGMGSFQIQPRAVIVKCNNGLIGTSSLRRVHLGGQMNEGEIQWSVETRNKNMELVISQTQDAIKTYLSKDYLNGMIRKLDDYKNMEFRNPIDVVENISTELSISSEDKYNVIAHFLNDGDTKTGLGVFNAFTRGCQNLNPDDQYKVEINITKILDNKRLLKKFDVAKN